MTEPALMVGLGELLWDLLPSGKFLGGAPANFAYMANALGDRGVIASRLGNDALGREAYGVLQRLGLTASYVQLDENHVTGRAEVVIDSGGSPTFTIKEAVSWDFLEWTASWRKLAERADVICFGSLAQRSPASAATIEKFLLSARPECLRIFDVNLRQSFHSADVLARSLHHATIVKLTDQELARVSSVLLSGKGDEVSLGRRLLSEFDLKLVCVTRGARGSLLLSGSDAIEHKGLEVKVVDTIGAGDAFTACLAHHWLRGRSLVEMSDSANRLASWVVTQPGAMPAIEALELRELLDGGRQADSSGLSRK